MVKRAAVLRAMLALLLLAWSAAASAAVEIAFYSKEFGRTFPHAFVRLTGTLDATGESVDAVHGFTVMNQIGPSVLLGPVKGKIVTHSQDYVAKSQRHFALTLSDAEYRAVLALVERWRGLPQPSYSLERRNCVSFVAEVAKLVGLSAGHDSRLIKRPHGYLAKITRENAVAIAARAQPSTPLAAAR